MLSVSSAEAESSRSFTAIRKDAGLYCGSRLRKGEVFAYVGRNQNLKDLKGRAPPPLSAELGVQLTQSRTLPGQPMRIPGRYWSHCFSPDVDYWRYCPTPHFPHNPRATVQISGGRAPLGCLIHTWTSCAGKALLRRTKVRTCRGRISPYSGPECV